MKIKILSLLILVLLSTSQAQLGVSVQTQSGYTDNSFSNYRSLPDYYTGLEANINNDWIYQKHGVRLYVNGDLGIFQKYNNRNYQNVESGLIFYKYWSKSNHHLKVGFDIGKRFHTPDYQWFELTETNFYINNKFIINEQTFAYIGFSALLNNYSYLDAFSHHQINLYTRLSKFFDSGTTLIAEVNLLSKNYLNSDTTSTIEELPEIVTLGTGKSQQIVSMLKAAQAITPTTGINVKFLSRNNLSSSVRYLGTYDGVYYSDDEIFNDVYGYNSYEFSGKLTKYFPGIVQLSVYSEFQKREYDKRIALDLEGLPFPDNRLREDDKFSYGINLKKNFRIANKLQPISITLSWVNIANSSNDPYYDYKSQFITLGISQSF